MAQINETLSLLLPLPDVEPKVTLESNSLQSNTLWLALALPQLPIEIIQRRNHYHAVVQERKGRYIVHLSSVEAENMGVVSGMSLHSAYSLCHALSITTRDEQGESEALRAIALWATQFTPVVHIGENHCVLLEIAGSLALFGGIESLREEFVKSLRTKFNYCFSIAITPAAAASNLLACLGKDRVILHSEQLRSELGDVSIHSLPLDLKYKRQLIGIGAKTLRDVWRLPKADLSRRFGLDLTRYLDKLQGNVYEPRHHYPLPKMYEKDWFFPLETQSSEWLLHALSRLIEGLVGFLGSNQLAVNAYSILFFYEKNPRDLHTISLRSATRDMTRIMLVTKEYVETMALPSPVIGVGIQCDQFEKFTESTQDLLTHRVLSPTENSAEVMQGKSKGTSVEINSIDDIHGFIERCQARLGEDSLRGIRVFAEHRPELAQAYTDVAPHDNAITSHPRPLWLLSAPTSISLHGLVLWRGPERIESGWWDGMPIKRDYYLASDSKGRRLWVYRDLFTADQWYLHGLFA